MVMIMETTANSTSNNNNIDDPNDHQNDQLQAYLENVRTEEAAILRECVYALQGISGERLRFVTTSSASATTSSNDSGAATGASLNFVIVQQQQQSNNNDDLPIPPTYLRQSALGVGSTSATYDAINICGEAGWLFLRIQSFVTATIRQRDSSSNSSSIARALAGSMEEELQSYRNFVAQFDMNTNINKQQQQQQQQQQHSPSNNLRQLVIDILPCFSRLKTLAMIADGLGTAGSSSACNGGGSDILTALYQHSQCGDTRHAQLVRKLWNAASKPWLRMLHSWITQGILLLSSSNDNSDSEFFVIDNNNNVSSSLTSMATGRQQQHDANDDDDDNNKYLWRDRFRIDYDKVPLGNIESNLVEPAFLVGKGINYIHKCLMDCGWSLLDELHENNDDDDNDGANPIIDFDTMINRPSTATATTHNYISNGGGGAMLQIMDLSAPIETAARLVHSHILTSLRKKHGLMQHFFALKQFLLLGQGDFFSSLLDGMYAEYENRCGIAGIYKHNLMAIVDTAIRSTNASSFPPDMLQRLDVELLLDKDDEASYTFGVNRDAPPDNKDDRTVWSIFCLKYTVPDPLIAVVPSSAMAMYKRMFVFLFRLRKVAFSLALTWRQSAVLSHALQTSAHRNALSIQKSPNYALANALLTRVAITRQSMIHFVTNLTSYLMLEVLGSGWKKLVRRIDDATTLDEVIEAHEDYLKSICQKSLLPRDKNNDEASIGINYDDELGDKVQDLLLVASEFCANQEKLFGQGLREAEKAAEKRRHAEERLKEGDWGFQVGVEELHEEDTFFGLADEAKLADLDAISNLFHEIVAELLQALDRKLHYGGVHPVIAKADDMEGPAAAAASTTTPVSHPAASSPPRSNEQYEDLDSLRFLALQLDDNNFYDLAQE